MRYAILMVLLWAGCVERPEPEPEATPFDMPLGEAAQEAAGSFALTATINLGGRIHHAPQVWGMNGVWGHPGGALSINDAGTLRDGGYVAPLTQQGTVDEFFNRFNRGDAGTGLENLRLLGVRDIRYPGGCPADDYQPAPGSGTADGQLALRHAHLADGRHSVNQALTPYALLKVVDRLDDGRGLTVTWQINANLFGGNPCGKAAYYPPTTGTDEAQKRAQRSARLLADLDILIQQFKDAGAAGADLARLRAFEIGNEQWFVKTEAEVDAYFTFADAAAQKLRAGFPNVAIYLQGYPVTGNNMEGGSSNATIRARWDQRVAERLNLRCGSYLCFDAITDHYYASAQQATNLTNLFHFAPPGMAARWAARELVDLQPEALVKYSPRPVNATEWNLICWSRAKTDVVRVWGIDGDTAPWTPIASANALGSATPATPLPALSGQALKVTMSRSTNGQTSHYLASREVPVSATVPPDAGTQSQGYLKAGRSPVLSTQVYTSRPANTYVQLAWKMSDGTYAYPASFMWSRQLKSVLPNTWSRVAVTADYPIPSGATHVRLELGLHKSTAEWTSDASDVVAWFDDIFIETNCDEDGGVCSRAARTTGSNLSGGSLDQTLALAEGLLSMARHGQPLSASHLHNLDRGWYQPASGTDGGTPVATMDRVPVHSCGVINPNDPARTDDPPLTAGGLAFQFTSPFAAAASSVVTLVGTVPVFTVPRNLEQRHLECTTLACLRPCEGEPTEDAGSKLIYPANCTPKTVREVSVYGGVSESQRKVYAFVINRHKDSSAAMTLSFTEGQYSGISRFLSQRNTTLQGSRGYLSRIDYTASGTLLRNEISVSTTTVTPPASGTSVPVTVPPMSAVRVELGY